MPELLNGKTYNIVAKPVDSSGVIGSLTAALVMNLNPASGLSIVSNQTNPDGSATLQVKNQNSSQSNGSAVLNITGASAAGPLSDQETYQVDGVPGPNPATAIQVTVTEVP